MILNMLYLLILLPLAAAENVYCTYYRDTDEITCGIPNISLGDQWWHRPSLSLFGDQSTGEDRMNQFTGVTVPFDRKQLEKVSEDKQSDKAIHKTVTCATHIPPHADLEKEGFDVKLPRGWYRIGMLQIRHDTSWMNLYRRRATGSGYWDFYTNIPERNCIGGFGIHAGENIPGSVTVKDKKCFDRLVFQIERKSTSEKFDVHQCRNCIFHSCWLGSRLLPHKREYLTNLRSY